jgi:hypothetical protein
MRYFVDSCDSESAPPIPVFAVHFYSNENSSHSLQQRGSVLEEIRTRHGFLTAIAFQISLEYGPKSRWFPKVRKEPVR